MEEKKRYSINLLLITLFFFNTVLITTKVEAKNYYQKANPITVNVNIDSLRTSNWTEDLLFLKRKFEEEHYDLYRVMKKRKWNKNFDVLIQKISKLKDHEVITEVMKILSKVGSGHSTLFLPYKGKYHFHRIPIAFHEFKEGVFIKGAHPDYAHLVGKKVLAIGGVPIKEVKSRLKTITNRDNNQWIKVLGIEVYMTIPEILYSLQLTNNIEKVQIEVLNEDEQISTTTVTADLLDISTVRHLTVRPEWVSAHKNSKNELPLYRKHTNVFPNDFYWFEYIESKSMVYFQFNAVINKPTEDIKSFCDRMFQFISDNNVDKLVVDIRLNSGGNGQLNEAVVNSIAQSKRINQNGNLFVVIGRRTFSAGMTLATDLEQHTNAIFVGEPTGSSPNFVGDDNPFTLPHSGLTASAANRYWQGSTDVNDKRKWLTPSIQNILSFNDYKNNIDPIMTAIFNWIAL